MLPEDVDHQLQADVLYLCIETSLPVPALGSQGVGIGGGSEVTQLQVVVKLETLHPAGIKNNAEAVKGLDLDST